MSRFLTSLLCLGALCWSSACRRQDERPKEERFEKISEDPFLQQKFESASRTLAEIHEGKRRNQDIFAHCKTAEMLFMRDLKRLPAPAAGRVVRDLEEACRGARLQ